MKICIAQIESVKGNVQSNVDKHFAFIRLAIEHKVDLIVFPELSITGYHPKLAKAFTDGSSSPSFDLFQKVSNNHTISIGIGLPTLASHGINISMVVFQPRKERTIYSKQLLHSDEFPYFVEGKKDVLLKIGGSKIAFGICYESLQRSHFERVIKNGAELLIASVAKPQNGIEKAEHFFPNAAREFKIPVLMSNCIGVCEDFIGAGQSTVWNVQKKKLEQLNSTSEGIIIFDTTTNSIEKK